MTDRAHTAEDAIAVTAEGGDALILPDHVHPNAAGHGKIAEIFAAATRL